MRFSYIPKGVCATRIDMELEGNVLCGCTFIGGCNGNGKGLALLAKGRRIDELIPLLKDVACDGHASCPAQLAAALQAYQNQAAGEYAK